MIAVGQNANFRRLTGMYADGDSDKIVCVLGDEYNIRKFY